ncbi:MAG: hypothetical protein LQ346_005688 [Caloplaca aetnensis]|nr:MAG: hypothetical protein LQ346_005688 [Caloplaca aetnensis]
MPIPQNDSAFTDAMADILRLPDETLALAYLYLNKYLRFHRTSQTSDPLDSYTLSLATLSLASKSTESPRRLSSILLPAYALLYPPATQAFSSLTVPSPKYDALRATLVQAELILLRILGFQLRLPSPLEFLQRYLERATEDVDRAGEDYDAWDKEAREEYGVINGVTDTRMGQACRMRVLEACKDYQLANLFPMRAVALGVVYTVLEDRGLRIEMQQREWVKDVGSGKVDHEDFEEVVEILKKKKK